MSVPGPSANVERTRSVRCIASKFHRANLQYFGAKARHFKHFFKGNAVEPAGAIGYTRVGGVHTVNICVNLAFIGF